MSSVLSWVNNLTTPCRQPSLNLIPTHSRLLSHPLLISTTMTHFYNFFLLLHSLLTPENFYLFSYIIPVHNFRNIYRVLRSVIFVYHSNRPYRRSICAGQTSCSGKNVSYIFLFIPFSLCTFIKNFIFMKSAEIQPTFWRNTAPPFSGSKDNQFKKLL
jgi:hypothetical protein